MNDDQHRRMISLLNNFREWISGEAARSTWAGTLVVLHKLSEKCPLEDSDIFTTGGQISGGRGQALSDLLCSKGVPDFLRDGVTTRSTNKFRTLLELLDYGKPLAELDECERRVVIEEMEKMVRERIEEWASSQAIAVSADRRKSPVKWIEEILEVAQGKSGGRVEQHLVGAKFEVRYPGMEISRHAATAADVQTERAGDFTISRCVFHVTRTPGPQVVEKCASNIRAGLHPVLIVPRDQVERAKGIASAQDVEHEVTVLAIEDFIATNVVEIAGGDNIELIDGLRRIVNAYNSRIRDSESDRSLQIEIE